MLGEVRSGRAPAREMLRFRPDGWSLPPLARALPLRFIWDVSSCPAMGVTFGYAWYLRCLPEVVAP